MRVPDEAFDRLIDEYATTLMHHAYALTHDHHGSEDLVQETLLKAYKNWSRVQAAENKRAYLLKILLNEFLQARRKQSVREEYESEIDEPHIDARLEGSLWHDTLMRAVQNLKPRRRAVLVLRYLEDCSDEEIARILSCRKSTVRSLARRALQDLRNETVVSSLRA